MSEECWLVDLDGVMWLANQPIPGSAEAVRRLKQSGRRVAFFTNNSFARRSELHAKFQAHGVECSDDDLFSSSQAAALLLEKGARAFVLGGPGIVEALEARGVLVADEASTLRDGVDAVLVGLDMELRFSKLTTATRAVQAGARLIATNDDATYPTPDGPLPGGGALVAAVAYATGETPVVAGKPYPPAVELVTKAVGQVAVMVGDRPETDGTLATRLGAKYALVRSGVVPPGVEVDHPVPDFDARDLASLVDGVLGSR